MRRSWWTEGDERDERIQPTIANWRRGYNNQQLCLGKRKRMMFCKVFPTFSKSGPFVVHSFKSPTQTRYS